MMNIIFADRLVKGETVQFRPKGNSMNPLIKSGQLVTVAPCKDIQKGDIVFCKVKGKFYVHLVSAVNSNRYQISNNKGYINGWIGINSIFGKVISIND